MKFADTMYYTLYVHLQPNLYHLSPTLLLFKTWMKSYPLLYYTLYLISPLAELLPTKKCEKPWLWNWVLSIQIFNCWKNNWLNLIVQLKSTKMELGKFSYIYTYYIILKKFAKKLVNFKKIIVCTFTSFTSLSKRSAFFTSKIFSSRPCFVFLSPIIILIGEKIKLLTIFGKSYN